ncbi:putative transcription initiation factor TFIID subunit 4b-like [Capsicum annuum]|nr:putative transcription initiation factor TFIID subunit 4b-like [Capsicum annuum]
MNRKPNPQTRNKTDEPRTRFRKESLRQMNLKPQKNDRTSKPSVDRALVSSGDSRNNGSRQIPERFDIFRSDLLRNKREQRNLKLLRVGMGKHVAEGQGMNANMIQWFNELTFQDNGYGPSTVDEGEAGKINLEDYRHPMDPVPSSKASVRPGPIEHGTPLMPYIPKQPPPPPPPTRSKPVVGFP